MFCNADIVSPIMVLLFFYYRHIVQLVGYWKTGRLDASACGSGNERHVCTLCRRRPGVPAAASMPEAEGNPAQVDYQCCQLY